jgi:hypothetical protein
MGRGEVGVRVAEKVDFVKRCVPRQDGGWMVVTTKGAAGSSPEPIHEGARVLIRGGIAVRP